MSKAILVSSAAARVLYEKARSNEKLVRWVRIAAIVLLAVGALTIWTLGAFRFAQKKALDTYRGWVEEYKIERLAVDQANADADPYQRQLDAEAEMLARVLYGVKDNSTDDLRTYCWCVFNRVDNALYPDTLAEVIAQPKQWMRYSPENPVLEDLYQIARAELDAWHTGTTRPCSAEYIYMTWSPSRIVLRDTWEENSWTDKWRIAK